MRSVIKPGWIPPASPYCLIQEHLFPNEWLILVSCMMLNCTSRRQVDKVLPAFMDAWPRPEAFVVADVDHVVHVCRSLGFANRRTKNLMSMTQRFIDGGWEHALDLPGIGGYAARAWEIFCRAQLGDDEPQDHALKLYWRWAMSHMKQCEIHCESCWVSSVES